MWKKHSSWAISQFLENTITKTVRQIRKEYSIVTYYYHYQFTTNFRWQYCKYQRLGKCNLLNIWYLDSSNYSQTSRTFLNWLFYFSRWFKHEYMFNLTRQTNLLPCSNSVHSNGYIGLVYCVLRHRTLSCCQVIPP